MVSFEKYSTPKKPGIRFYKYTRAIFFRQWEDTALEKVGLPLACFGTDHAKSKKGGGEHKRKGSILLLHYSCWSLYTSLA